MYLKEGAMEVIITEVKTGTNLITDSSEAYHLRCEVDRESRLIHLGVFDEGKIQVITIKGVTPFMGHPKTNSCCQEALMKFQAQGKYQLPPIPFNEIVECNSAEEVIETVRAQLSKRFGFSINFADSLTIRNITTGSTHSYPESDAGRPNGPPDQKTV